MKTLTILCACALGILQTQAQPKEKTPRRSAESGFQTQVPAHSIDLILGRPTNCSISFSILAYEPGEAFLVYSIPGKVPEISSIFQLRGNRPLTVEVEGLNASCKYNYRLMVKSEGKTDFMEHKSGEFYTQRKPGQNFVCTITADSHLDENSDLKVYEDALLHIASDSADFHIDLGDTFMTDKYREHYTDAFQQYLAQRYYFSQTRTPLFLVLGNHDGEQGGQRNGDTESILSWSTLQRKTYFPNPENSSFYSANPDKECPQDYYSWTWGDTQFIVLDPFRYSPRSANDQPWDRTLGKTQYEWLRQVLSTSKSKYKLVFIHNLVGGIDNKGKGRGGAEVADKYEWGGNNAEGVNEFSKFRNDWEMPIHSLLRKYHVTAVFHGHDHVYARQEKDGIIYQCLPQPGAFKTGSTRYAEEYGYQSGTIKSLAGYLRLNLSPTVIHVSLIDSHSGQVADMYDIR